MSDYWFSDYVAHGKGKGRKAGYVVPNHKYLFRIKVGDDYQYFYTLSEWQNRFKKKAKGLVDKAKKAIGGKEKTNGKESSKSQRKFEDILSKPLKKVGAKAKEAVKNAIDRIDRKIDQKKADQRHETQRKNQSEEYKKFAENSRVRKEEEKANIRHESFRNRNNNEFKDLANKAIKRFKDYQSKNEPKDHKYLAKIKMANGKFRYFYDQSELNAYYKKNPEQRAGNLPLKKESETPSEDMANVNPGFHVGDDYNRCGFTHNCYSCALAYDMRRRGYNVNAIYDEDGATDDKVVAAYKNAKWDNDMGSDNGSPNSGATLEKNMVKKYGKNSRGVMAVRWSLGGGHALAWEIDENSKLTIYDAQTNTKYTRSQKRYTGNPGETQSLDTLINMTEKSKTIDYGFWNNIRYRVDPFKGYTTGGIKTLRTDDKEPSKKMLKYVTDDYVKTMTMRDPDTRGKDYKKHRGHYL